MATQGLVSVCKDGQVVMKVVAGIDGQFAKVVAEYIQMMWPLDALEARNIAAWIEFGGIDVTSDRLVVVTSDDHQPADSDLPDLYRTTFTNPEFNPRWECGLADHVEIVHVG